MVFKKYLIRFLAILDSFLPIFSKDSIYSFSFETKAIVSLPVNKRVLGMQYWCDLEGNVFVSRFSSYIGRNETGFLFHSWPDWKLIKKIDLCSDSILCPRLIDGTLFALNKGAETNVIFNLKTGKPLRCVPEPWFDVFVFKGNRYIISGSDVFSLQFKKSGEVYLSEHCKIDLGENVGECSAQEYSGKLYVVARIFKDTHSALGCHFKLFETSDLSNFQSSGDLFPVSMFGRNCFSGVGFPTLRNVDDKLCLFFAGYWGWHFLLPHTIWSWHQQGRALNCDKV